MRKILSFCICCLAYTWASAQIEFVPGYVLKADGTRTDCQIEDKEWRNSPDQFSFKIGDELFTQSASSDSIVGFGVTGGSHYLRYAGKIDQSSDVVTSLSETIEPELQRVAVYLKVLLQGELSLLCYDRQGSVRYLYQPAGEVPVPLEWKMYNRDRQICYNNRFRKQLSTVLDCDAIAPNDLYHIEYDEKALKTIFSRYNVCVGAEVQTFKKVREKSPFYIYVVASGNYHSFKVQSLSDPALNAGPGHTTGISAGFNLEKVLPFNKNKWAFFIEPVFETIKLDFENGYRSKINQYDVDYKGIDLKVGLRHYFYLQNKNALFANVSCDYNVAIRSNMMINDEEFDLGNIPRFSFGFGYHCNKQVSAELRYSTARNLTSKYRNLNTHLQTFSFVLSYRIKQ